MSDYCSDNLEADVARQKAKRNTKNKGRYSLVRELGFDSNECKILMNKPVGIIFKIARERGIDDRAIKSIAQERGIEVPY